LKTVAFIFGTRPEAIKLAPLIHEFNEKKKFKTIVILTGQHQEMLHQVLDAFAINPDLDLRMMRPNQNLSDLTARMIKGLQSALDKLKPDFVFVHGDTTTALCGALVSFYQGISVGHVEAGLRTYDLSSPFPEEMNRQVVDLVSTLHFAPTPEARQNLISAGLHPQSIYVTGNTVIDALILMTKHLKNNKNLATNIADKYPMLEKKSRILLVTLHRRENFGARILNTCSVIKRLANLDDILIIFPVHLNPNIKNLITRELAGINNILLLEPLPYPDLCFILNKCYLVITDSGGLQEEAPALNKPVLVVRDTTERPEGLEAGTLKLVGGDAETLYQEVMNLWNDHKAYEKMASAINPYGNGSTSKMIHKTLEHLLHRS
jgi:UDP-N-acetylglucosamine 2-epimerase